MTGFGTSASSVTIISPASMTAASWAKIDPPCTHGESHEYKRRIARCIAFLSLFNGLIREEVLGFRIHHCFRRHVQ